MVENYKKGIDSLVFAVCGLPKTWKNITFWKEVTYSPTKKNRYIKLKVNPNPKRNDKAFVRKYLRKDPIKTRGELLEKFNLSEEDLKEIENYLKNKKS